MFLPLLGHHQESLDQQSLQNLRTNTLEERHGALVLYDVLHDFGESLERLAVPRWRWLRLETDFGNNEGLCCNRSEHLGQRSKD